MVDVCVGICLQNPPDCRLTIIPMNFKSKYFTNTSITKYCLDFLGDINREYHRKGIEKRKTKRKPKSNSKTKAPQSLLYL